jgi:hypothetical protein
MMQLVQDFRQKLIKYAYNRWSNNDCELSDGYTILLPIPSDLPVFLSLAIEIIKKQDLTGAKELLIIPDWPSASFEKFCKDIAKQCSSLPMRYVSLGMRDQLAWTLSKGITTRHFTQLVRGIEETCTKYAFIQDSDAFLQISDFIKTQYETCYNRGLAVYGVESRRSMAREDRDIFVSTWEMMFSIAWVKSFPPFMHKGQYSFVNSSRQEFDTMLLPQYLTDKKLIDYTPRNGDFFHFRFVIATYRNFLNKRQLQPNYGLKLFLIRTLIDVFDISGWNYQNVPTHNEFLEGKFGLSELQYLSDGLRYVYEFKGTLQGIINARIFNQHQSEALSRRLVDLLCSLKVDPN